MKLNPTSSYVKTLPYSASWTVKEVGKTNINNVYYFYGKIYYIETLV